MKKIAHAMGGLAAMVAMASTLVAWPAPAIAADEGVVESFAPDVAVTCSGVTFSHPEFRHAASGTLAESYTYELIVRAGDRTGDIVEERLAQPYVAGTPINFDFPDQHAAWHISLKFFAHYPDGKPFAKHSLGTLQRTSVPCAVPDVEVTPSAPTASDVRGTEEDVLSVPEDNAELTYTVDDQRDGGVGMVNVVALARPGFVIADGVQDRWSFEFTDEDCPVTPEPQEPAEPGETDPDEPAVGAADLVNLAALAGLGLIASGAIALRRRA